MSWDFGRQRHPYIWYNSHFTTLPYKTQLTEIAVSISLMYLVTGSLNLSRLWVIYLSWALFSRYCMYVDMLLNKQLQTSCWKISNVKKASGPDNVSCKILYELVDEIAPVLCYIYNQSLELGELFKVWTDANVSLLFKKGNRHVASNYRPMPLLCITCKVLEHVLCWHIPQHVEEYGILMDLQHSFRSGHPCKTQLLITLQDLEDPPTSHKNVPGRYFLSCPWNLRL